MGMTATCTAPREGHDPNSKAERECPVHGHGRAAVGAPSLAAPTLSRPKASLSDALEFDHPMRVNDDGTVSEVDGVYAPGFYDGEVEGGYGDEWEALTGYTGQYGYNGPVMHQSEYIGGDLEDAIWDEPGVYCVVVAQSLVDEEGNDLEEAEDAGWVVLRHKEQAPDKNGAPA